MDHEALAKQLIRALRGERSQVALSRRMRCKSNVIYTWESGRRWPTAAVFFHLAARVGVDLRGRVGEFLGGLPEALLHVDFEKPSGVAALLCHLRGGTTLVELARRVGTNRVSASRWLKGEAEPRLPDFLRLVDVSSLRLLDFVAVFADPATLDETRRAWKVLEAQRAVAYQLPWSHAVMRVLELRDYRRLPAHETGYIARRLGISEDEEVRCLEALAASGVIAKRKGRWGVRQVLTVDTRKNPGAGRALKRHWAQVGLDRLPSLEPNENDLFSFNLFTVSERDWERLRELHIAYYHDLRRIIEESRPGERVALANLQLMRLDERPVVAGSSMTGALES